MINFSWTSTFKTLRSTAIAVVAAISLNACAMSAPPPTQELQAAEAAIATAEQERVGDHAGPELNAAREKLTAARSAVQAEDMVLAAYLATESRADAQLASARTAMLKNQAINVEMQQSIDTLKQEMQRNSGVRQ